MGAAAALVSELHGELLRALSQHAGRHFEGLAQASRSFPTLSPRLRRRLRNLDTTFAYIRHVTKPLSDNFLSEVLDAVSTSVPVFASPSTSCSTTPSLATPSTSADTCDADQVPRDEGQHPRAEDHQPREHPAPRDEHHDSTNLKMICESINLMSDAFSAMNSTNANNFTMIKNAQMESRNFKVMNEMNKTIQPETKTTQGESKATCSSSSTATSSGPSTPSSASPRPLCRVSSPTTSPSPSSSAESNPKTDVIPGTSAASPSTPASSVANDNRCTGEGDDDESLPASSPELTMIHDMLKSAHTQLITMNARYYGFAARSPD